MSSSDVSFGNFFLKEDLNVVVLSVVSLHPLGIHCVQIVVVVAHLCGVLTRYWLYQVFAHLIPSNSPMS